MLTQVSALSEPTFAPSLARAVRCLPGGDCLCFCFFAVVLCVCLLCLCCCPPRGGHPVISAPPATRSDFKLMSNTDPGLSRPLMTTSSTERAQHTGAGRCPATSLPLIHPLCMALPVHHALPRIHTAPPMPSPLFLTSSPPKTPPRFHPPLSLPPQATRTRSRPSASAATCRSPRRPAWTAS